MHVGLYATKIQANVMKEREEIETAYDRYPDATLFWGFVDLVGSSNYRIAHGLKAGYVRGETFFSLVRCVIAPCAEIHLVKEIGDAVLLSSLGFRPLFESVLLMDQACRQMADIAGTERFPFAIRAGIGFGPAKRLSRGHDDYLGVPIDQLSRIMAIRSEVSNLLIGENALKPSNDIAREYSSVVEIREPKMVPEEKSKGAVRPIYYHEVIVDHVKLPEFRDHFAHWR